MIVCLTVIKISLQLDAHAHPQAMGRSAFELTIKQLCRGWVFPKTLEQLVGNIREAFGW